MFFCSIDNKRFHNLGMNDLRGCLVIIIVILSLYVLRNVFFELLRFVQLSCQDVVSHVDPCLVQASICPFNRSFCWKSLTMLSRLKKKHAWRNFNTIHEKWFPESNFTKFRIFFVFQGIFHHHPHTKSKHLLYEN